MFDAARIATETERALWKFADPARAIAEKRYLKSDLDHMGASVSQIRGVTRQVVADHPALTRRELLAVLREGKSRPDEVFNWFLPRAARASGVTMREAVKYLPASKREKLLAAWKPAKRTD